MSCTNKNTNKNGKNRVTQLKKNKDISKSNKKINDIQNFQRIKRGRGENCINYIL